MPDSHSHVLARGRMTSYERVGRGPAALALVADRREAGPWIDELSARFRVVLPRVAPAAPGSEGAVLGEFVEALGLERPPVITDAAMAGTALQLALVDPWRVGAIAVLVPLGGGGRPGVRARGTLEPIGVPVLCLPVPARPGAVGALRPLLAFLDEALSPGARSIDNREGGERNLGSPSG